MFTTPDAAPDRCAALVSRAPSNANIAAPPPTPITSSATTNTAFGSTPGHSTSNAHATATETDNHSAKRSRRSRRPATNCPTTSALTMKAITENINSDPAWVSLRPCACVNHGAPHNVVIATNWAISTKCTQNECFVPRSATTARNACPIFSPGTDAAWGSTTDSCGRSLITTAATTAPAPVISAAPRNVGTQPRPSSDNPSGSVEITCPSPPARPVSAATLPYLAGGNQ